MTTNTLSELTAIAPMDGRYAAAAHELRAYFSEFGLIRYRVMVEVEWLIFLSDLTDVSECPALSHQDRDNLRSLVTKFSPQDASKVKDIEKVTNHDVKAVEYFLRERLAELDIDTGYARFIHFACTSEDINNLAYALMVRDARQQVLLPATKLVTEHLQKLVDQYHDLPMLSRTHGQTASPTTLGKEVRNVSARLTRQIEQLEAGQILGKFNGAVGNYNAHVSSYPDLDWSTIGKQFVELLGLAHNPHTTQIEPHDWIAEHSHTLSRLNTILIDWCRDVWGYISLGYFSQIAVEGEVGSSTMPHKINPIQFENAEGNLGLANALFSHLAAKLPVSRWQRDLTDSTVLRNLGVAFAWSLIGWQSIGKGMSRLGVNKNRIQSDLDDAWEVLAEPVQTVMKRFGIDDAYEQLKAFTRGQQIDQKTISGFISQLDIPDTAKQELLALSPQSYTGLASLLARQN